MKSALFVLGVLFAFVGMYAGSVFTPISMIVVTLSIGLAVMWFMLLILYMDRKLYFVETSLLTCAFVIPMWIWDFFAMSRYNDIPKILDWLFK